MKNARRDHYARPRTAPDMHHDASYEVASSAEVIQGRTARSRPSATRVIPRRGKRVNISELGKLSIGIDLLMGCNGGQRLLTLAVLLRSTAAPSGSTELPHALDP